MKIYLFKNFNNYYNRIIIKYDSINEYTSNYEYAVRGYNNELKAIESGSQFNFNINDGIYSEVTYNYDPNQEFQPDYAIITENDDTIKYRYYVIEAKRIRKGQYKLILKRDVIADTYDYTIESPIYFERAMLSKNNPLIFKNENNSYNQIKKEEYLLKDKSKCAWIVGYVDRPKSTTQDKAVSIKLLNNYDYAVDKTIDAFIAQLINPNASTVNPSKKKILLLGDDLFSFSFQAAGQKLKTAYNTYYLNNNNISSTISLNGGSNKYYRENNTEANIKTNILYDSIDYKLVDTAREFVKKYYTILHPSIASDYEFLTETNISQYKDKLVKCSDNEIYKINVSYSTVSSGLYHIQTDNLPTYSITNETVKEVRDQLISVYDNIANKVFYVQNASMNKMYGFDCEVPYKTYTVTYTKVSDGEYKTNISSQRLRLADAPYSMFCIPYPIDNDIYVKNTASNTYKVDPQASLFIATGISEELAEGCYDIQLVPYCPLQQIIDNTGDNIVIDVYNYSATKSGYWDEVYRDKDTNNVSVIIWCDRSNFTFNIDKNLSVKSNDIDFKVQDETEFYRLNSPNYNGTYEFKATRNNGVDYFNIDCSYKPYTPYIHINPNYKYMYGNDFNDANGLICSGNFSLTQTTDQWKNYIVNNKTYQSQFDRQIENMDVNNNITNDQSKWSIWTGALQAGSTGAFIGNSIGGIGGGVIGGLASGALSTAAGYKDLEYQKQLQQENKSYATDIYNLNNESIKARPNTLNKVDSFNYNNKIYPFLERYDCTEIEKEQLTTQLKYNSMAVNLISTISNMKHTDKTFMKGKLIKYISNESNDNNFVLDLAEELNKGVYI